MLLIKLMINNLITALFSFFVHPLNSTIAHCSTKTSPTERPNIAQKFDSMDLLPNNINHLCNLAFFLVYQLRSYRVVSLCIASPFIPRYRTIFLPHFQMTLHRRCSAPAMLIWLSRWTGMTLNRIAGCLLSTMCGCCKINSKLATELAT